MSILYNDGETGSILTGTTVTRAGEAPVTFTPEEETPPTPAEEPVEQYAGETPAA